MGRKGIPPSKARKRKSPNPRKRKLPPKSIDHDEPIDSLHPMVESHDVGSVDGEDDDLITEMGHEACTSNNGYVLNGRRIVDISHLFMQLAKLDNHSPLGCRYADLKIISEKQEGMRSVFALKCKMCGFDGYLSTDDHENTSEKSDINTAATAGILAIGGGHSQLEEFCGNINMPCMSTKTYLKHERRVGEALLDTALDEMKIGAAEEAQLARDIGDVDVDGVPLIPVVADGSWAKRSYRTKYDSLSGLAAIIGYRTRKVLFVGVKNKYCMVCRRAELSLTEASEHVCFKNWEYTASSTSMESAIVLEGFRASEQMYGIRYNKLIADGDSSVYATLVQSRPYRHTSIEKIECKNHLLRNYCTKLRELCKDKRNGPAYLRKKVSSSILRLRTAISKAISYRKQDDRAGSLSDKISRLRKDILNSPRHIFGDHSNCAEYFCSRSNGDESIIDELCAAGLMEEINRIVGYLARHSRSLIQDLNSNCAEHFNAIVAKLVGGKRVNFSGRGSYKARAMGAVVSFNTGMMHSKLHRKLYSCSPGQYAKRMESRKKRRRLQDRKKAARRTLFVSKSADADYGPEATKPDVDDETYEVEKSEFLATLKLTAEDVEKLQKATVDQSNCTQWKEERRKRLTSSYFGTVFRMRSTTSSANLVNNILYSEFTTAAVKYGREKEQHALDLVELSEGIKVVRCGLFVDHDLPYLGASPDGLIGNDGVLEIKCPYSTRHLSPEDAISQKKLKYFTPEGCININHVYYFQIQGQLHVTRRQFCLFAVYTEVHPYIKTVKVMKDDDLWRKMEPRLTKFYHLCLLPELIDPRRSRNMPLREPKHILDAQEEANLKKTSRKRTRSESD